MQHKEYVMRFISTSEYTEFCNWLDFMMINGIRYKAKCSVNKAGEYSCSIEITEGGNDEIEDIKKKIGFYFD